MYHDHSHIILGGNMNHIGNGIIGNKQEITIVGVNEMPLPERALMIVLDYIGGQASIRACKEILELWEYDSNIAISQALKKEWIRIDNELIIKEELNNERV